MSKVLVFCIDALCASDVARMRRMPHFAQILERGALVEKIEPVLPALTYTCHTSILTGTYAGRHGIVHNEKMTRGGHLDAPWYCMKSDVRGKTLLDIARENGLTTCSLSWPVSGGADYTMNMPMIVPYSYQGYQPQQWLEHTATANLMDRYFYKHGRYLMGPTRSLDLFTMALALDILEDGPQPDIMLVKLCDLDSARHTYGVESEQAETQLRMHDEQLGAILECLRRKGTLDETNIIVLGDHGQTDIRDAFLMNVYFRRLGLLTVDTNGKIASFDAVCHSTGLAALIEVRDPDNAALMARVREVLEALRHDPDVQLSMVLDAAEAQARYGLSGPFDFVVESSLPIAFGEYPAGDTLWRSCQPGDKKTGVATHGGSPAREEVTTFFAAGPDVRPGTVHGSRSMVDEAPTMAAMLGLTMPDVDGAPIFEILR